MREESSMSSISFAGAASYLPEKVIDNDYFKAASGFERHAMFRGTRLRHHIGATESATDMAVAATKKLAEQLNLDLPNDVDALITNITLPDLPFVGTGAALVGALGLRPRWVYDIHNGGCVSFIFMLDLARMLMQNGARSALICNLQTAAGRVFGQPDNVKLPQSAVPGDGCGVAYLVANDESPIRSIVTRTHGEFANDMQVSAPDGRDWWQPGSGAFNIDFSEDKLAAIVARGNRLVPEALHKALEEAQIKPAQIDTLITNQPNRIFLRNWRESVQVPEHKQVQTFDEHGNLFGAAIPVCLERAITTGVIKARSKVLLGGFSHAGDYSAAAVLEWRQHGH